MKASTLLRSSRASNLSVTFVRRAASTAPAATSSIPALHTRLTLPSWTLYTPLPAQPRTQYAPFSTSRRALKGLQPHSDEPDTPKTEPHTGSGSAAQISDAEYHEIADQYLDSVVLKLEEMSESNSEGLEVEFSAGVLTVTHPNSGTYVINKQPPNKQIWLSSPVSGPKRFDWVVSGAGQHEKEGSAIDAGDDGAGGRWVYLRDGSELTGLLKKELGVEVSKDQESDVVSGREGPGGGGASLE